MDYKNIMQTRHSVRAYIDKPIEGEISEKLISFIEECNKESGLHMQLVLNEPKAFNSKMAHYGHFSGVKNYVALIGKKSPALDELCGYYGEKVVLFAQDLGLNTCWVALTYKKIKSAFAIEKGEKLCVVIAIGYGSTQGVAHKSKAFDAVTDIEGDIPDWFKSGVSAALLAPTAMNQQKFTFGIRNGKVTAKSGLGFYTKMDLGIAKYHFELGAGKENFEWQN